MNKETQMLHMAAQGNNLDLLRQCLEVGVPVDAEDEMGDTPLVTAARSRSLEFALAIMAAGANINHIGYDGLTALHWAANSCDKLTVALIDAGANAAFQSSCCGGESPLDFAIHSGSTFRVKLLLSKGAPYLQKTLNHCRFLGNKNVVSIIESHQKEASV